MLNQMLLVSKRTIKKAAGALPALFITTFCAVSFAMAQDAHCQMQQSASKSSGAKRELAPIGEHLLVRLAPKANKQEVADLLSEVNGTVVNTISTNDGSFTLLVVAAEKGKTSELTSKLRGKKDKNLAGITANARLRVQAAGAPNDPYYSQQWHLPLLKYAQARAISPSHLNLIEVAFIDTGVTPNYTQDLAGLFQYNFADESMSGSWEQPHDVGVPGTNGQFYHGTGVVAVAAARTNAMGITGVGNPRSLVVQTTMLRVSDGQNIYLERVLAAMAWLVNNRGVPGQHGPVNISLGPLNQYAEVQDLARQLRDRGCLVVLASGNQGMYDASPEQYCVRVAALNRALLRSPYSNAGPFYTAAPGDDILTYMGRDINDVTPAPVSGTSYAAAVWTGCIANVMAVHPRGRFTAYRAHTLLLSYSFQTSDGWRYPNLRATVGHIVGK